MESSSLSGSSKRAKALSNVAQVAHCLVDGCNADLSQCREYHRRHKVCESHSKTPKVTIGGREQRFCQQCSRFHSLAEFDEVKRSCRKRLDGHNRRRRKPQPDSLSKSPGMLFSSQHGAKLMSFSSSQIFPTSPVTSTWPVFSKPENDMVMYNNNNNQPRVNYIDTQTSFPNTSGHSYKGVNQFQFLQCNDRFTPEAAISQPIDHKLFNDRALSLLSSVNREIGLSHVVQPESSIPEAQPLVHGLHYGGLNQYNVMQNGAPDGSSASASGSYQMHTFMWDQE